MTTAYPLSCPVLPARVDQMSAPVAPSYFATRTSFAPALVSEAPETLTVPVNDPTAYTSPASSTATEFTLTAAPDPSICSAQLAWPVTAEYRATTPSEPPIARIVPRPKSTLPEN